MISASRTGSNTLSSVVLALILAVLIWVAATNNELQRVTNYPATAGQGVPIELRNIPEGLMVAEWQDRPVYVDLLIPREQIGALDPSDLVARVDLSELEPGEHTVEVEVETRPGAPPLRLVEVRPERITVTLDREDRLALPVEVVIPDLDTIPLNYQVLTPTLETPRIQVVGPQTVLESLERAVAEVEVEGSRAPVTTEVVPRLIDVEGNEVDTETVAIDPRNVEVTVPIEQKPGNRDLIVRTVITGTTQLAERGYWVSRVFPDPSVVPVVGQPEVVAALEGVVETETVDVSQLEEGVVTRQVPIMLPSDVSAVGEDAVEVTIWVEPQTSSKTVTLAPRVVGLSSGLVVSPTVGITPSTIDVVLQGPINELEQLTLDEVTATLDLEGRGAGTHLIRPDIEAPGRLRTTSIIPEQVEVTVVEQQEESRDLSLPVTTAGLSPDVFTLLESEPKAVTVALKGRRIS